MITAVDSEEFSQSLRDVIEIVAAMSISGGKYTEEAVNEFVEVADSRIIAYAHCYHTAIVTEETLENKVTRVKIPKVCQEMGIQCNNLQTLLTLFSPVFPWDDTNYGLSE